MSVGRDKPQEAGVASIFKLGAYRAAGGAALLTLGLVLGVTAVGGAQQSAPHVWSTPTISGTQQVTFTLTGTFGQATGPRDTTYGFVWMRCSDTRDDLRNCDLLDDTNSSTYTLQPRDQNRYMRVAQYARTSQALDYKVSAPTGAIQRAPSGSPASTPPPAKTPVPPAATPVPAPVTPVPAPVTPAATPVPAPTFDVAAPQATPVPNAGAVLQQTARKAKRM